MLIIKIAVMERIVDVIEKNQPQFNTISTSTTVRDALYKMYCENVDYLIVNEENRFAGILTEHDITSKVLFSDKPLQNTVVQEFMTTAIPIVTADDSLEYAMQLLEHHNARYLTVYDGFNFKAVISAQDLMRQALKKRNEIFGNLEDRQEHAWSY